MSVREWGRGSLVAAFAGSEVALSTSRSKSELLLSSQGVLEKVKELSGKRVVLAIGAAQGKIIDESDDSTKSTYTIRRAGDFVVVSEAAFRLWQWTLIPRSLDEFERRTKELPRSGAESLDYAHELEDLGLIAMLGPDRAGWNELAEELRPIPMGFGLGNSEADTLGFEISDATGRLRLRVHPLAFWIWLCWDGTLSISQAVDELVTVMPVEVTRELILNAAEELVLSCLAFGFILLDVINR